MQIRASRVRLGSWLITGSATFLTAAFLGADGQGRSPVPDRATIEHVLGRVTFGTRPADVEHVRAVGVAAYLDEQLHPERIDDTDLDARLAAFETLNLSSRELADRYFLPALAMRQALQQRGTAPGSQTPSDSAPQNSMRPDAVEPASQPPRQAPPAARVLGELTQARMLRAVSSERQLQEVLTDFWFNHFNVFAGKGQVRQYLTEYERDAIRPHVLGRFRELLGAVAHSPAMLFYLDNFQSAAPSTRRPLRPNAPAGLNENYARELMELHTLGVDAGYTQQDVTELARILTGWTIDQPRLGGRFLFRPAMHDNGVKRLLGTTFHADGQREGERALDLLAAHPATARHIAFKLAQRFVADDPPASLVEEAAGVFRNSDGDLRAVTRAILTSAEFMSPDARRAKVKTPLEFVTSAVRATGAAVRQAQPLVAALQNLGMPLYQCQPPTGYSMTADAWVNTGALLNRMNVALELVSGGRIAPVGLARRGQGPPEGPDASPMIGPGRARGIGPRPIGPIRVDVALLAPDTGAASRASVIDRLLGGVASDATRRTLERADTSQQLIALALGSPEFQRR